MSCYICGAPATSAEHAPAKSFFPTNYRNNLITVRSCALHNENTSKDDEYVRNILVMGIVNNAEGAKHFHDKGVRSLKHSSALLSLITHDMQDVFVHDLATGKIEPTKMLDVDRKRIDLVVRKIAYAIFNYKFSSVWNRELVIVTEHFVQEDLSPDELGKEIQDLSSLIPDGEYEGANPDIFKFFFINMPQPESFDDKVLVMRFYDGMEFWVFPNRNTNAPKLDS